MTKPKRVSPRRSIEWLKSQPWGTEVDGTYGGQRVRLWKDERGRIWEKRGCFIATIVHSPAAECQS
jgi:hypothetical protein